MIFQNFQHHDLMLFFPALACIIGSIWFYLHEKYTPALILLFVGALGLRIFMAHLDPYLWDWDERYHALVARNLLHHPLKPTLFDNPVLPYDRFNWTKNHVWVHKQPLALWQMALSFYFFGLNQFTARIPMAIEGAFLVLIIYRIGYVTINRNVGYLSALLYAGSFYGLNFMTGGEATDHIDYALVFYVSASLWAYIEYKQEFKIKWLIAVGFFAGLAVLSKWTIGLLVFPVWGIDILGDKEARTKIVSYLKHVLALLISMAVFIPWQLYCLAHYHQETVYELVYNQGHLLKEVDGRGETKWYYLEQLSHNYGPIVPYIIGFALIVLWQMVLRPDYKRIIFGSLFITYFLFSIIAATKMPAYCYIACVPMMLALGALLWEVCQKIKTYEWGRNQIIVWLIFSVFIYSAIDIHGIALKHSGYDLDNIYRVNKVGFTDYFKKMSMKIPKDYVVFGVPQGWDVEMMFYTGLTCYDRIPDLDKYNSLKAQGIKIAVIKSDKIPDFYLKDDAVLKLDQIN